MKNLILRAYQIHSPLFDFHCFGRLKVKIKLIFQEIKSYQKCQKCLLTLLITFYFLKYQLNFYYLVSRITNDFSESTY